MQSHLQQKAVYFVKHAPVYVHEILTDESGDFVVLSVTLGDCLLNYS